MNIERKYVKFLCISNGSTYRLVVGETYYVRPPKIMDSRISVRVSDTLELWLKKSDFIEDPETYEEGEEE
jgi:hypothetical protein